MKLDSSEIEQCFYGTATIGERGQVVIPAEARRDCGMHPGDKMLVFRHPMHNNMIILARVGEVQGLLQEMQELLNHMTHALESARQQSEDNQP